MLWRNMMQNDQSDINASQDAVYGQSLPDVSGGQKAGLIRNDPENATRDANIASFESLFIGPLPHPDQLESYERVLPGTAD